MTRVLWVHSGGWRSHAAISYVGVHNAWSFAAAGVVTQLLMPAESDEGDVAAELSGFYGVEPSLNLTVERLTGHRRWWQLRHPHYVRAERLARELRRSMPADERLIVLSREPRFLPFLARIAELPNTVTLYEPHYFFIDLSWRGDGVSAGDRRRGQLEQRWLPHIHGLVCITEEQARLYRRQLGSSSVLAAPLGTKALPVSSANHEEAWRSRRTLAYIGHLHSYKGVDALASLDTELRQADINAAFFGGSDSEVERRRQECRSRGADHITWKPFQPPARMFDALAGIASVGVVALEDTYYNRRLTCPVKALDFLSLGLPVVASDLPSTREVLGTAGRYFPPGRLDAMLRHARELLDDPRTYGEAAAAARKRSAELLWPRRAERILAFANDLASEQGRP